MKNFIPATQSQIEALTVVRPGETKLGERIGICDPEHAADCAARFVLLGIPEDIGVRANLGVAGTAGLWPLALKSLLNVQSTEKLDGSNLALAGAFDFGDLPESEDPGVLRGQIAVIDDAVFPLIRSLVQAGKIPVVVGGGHNNCYPLLKGASLALNAPLGCINLDAHSDFRQMEGRHSGNGFRYAHHEGFLKKYAIVGLHENYNSQAIVSELAQHPDVHFTYFEDIFIRRPDWFREAVEAGLGHIKKDRFGIELDLDSITGTLSSAMTPSGVVNPTAQG